MANSIMVIMKLVICRVFFLNYPWKNTIDSVPELILL